MGHHPGRPLTKDSPGVRELAVALADEGNRVLIWDRPNTGASAVCFTGSSESAMQADALAGLLRHLDLAPAVIAGGSGGSRVSLLTAARHPTWPPPWPCGGQRRRARALVLATHCSGSLVAARHGGMEAVAALPEWAEVLERTRPTGSGSSTRTPPPSSPRSSDGWWPTARVASSWCRGSTTMTAGRSTSPRSCCAAARATSTTPGRRPSSSPRCCRTPSWSSRPGATRVERAPGRLRRRVRGSSPVGRSWPRPPGLRAPAVGLMGATDRSDGSPDRPASRAVVDLAAPKVHVPRVAEVVAAHLRLRIVAGELRDGDALPRESVLLEEFGVSRPSCARPCGSSRQRDSSASVGGTSAAPSCGAPPPPAPPTTSA